MCNKSKSLALVLVLAMAVSSLTVLAIKPVNAQSTHKLSTPEFTVKYADHSYDVPPKTTTTTDPYTGQTKNRLEFGYHVKNITLDVAIKNQPFPPKVDGDSAKLQYTVLIKGHFEDE
jgi:hypothetical protein